MNYNGFADIVSDGKGGWLVSNLNENEDYKDVKYDSQGVLYLALNKGFDNNEYDEDEDDYARGGKLIGKQKNLDRNKNGIIDSEDLRMIRENKMAQGGEIGGFE